MNALQQICELFKIKKAMQALFYKLLVVPMICLGMYNYALYGQQKNRVYLANGVSLVENTDSRSSIGMYNGLGFERSLGKQEYCRFIYGASVARYSCRHVFRGLIFESDMDSKFAGDPLILGVGKNTSIYLFKLPAYLELGKTKWRWQTGLDLSLASSLFVKSIFFNSKFTLPLERRIGVVFHQSLSYSVNIDEIEVSVSPVFEYALVNYPLSSGLGWVTPRSMAIRVGVCF